MKKIVSSVLILSSLITTSCTSLNSGQKSEYREWQAQGVAVEDKSEGLAAGLNILPGIGDFYNGNVGLGIVNLVFWPASVLWAPVGGATGAAEVNYYETRVHVTKLERNKQTTMQNLHAAYMAEQLTKDEFLFATQKVTSTPLSQFKNALSVHEVVPTASPIGMRLPSSKK